MHADRRTGRTRRGRGALMKGMAAGLLASATLMAPTGGASAALPPGSSSPASATPSAAVPANPGFGSRVLVFDPSMPTAEIQARTNAIHAEQVNNEMGSQRYSLLFLPGTYGSAEQPLQLKVGYYTEVAGLGASPADVRIIGKVEAFNRCFDADGNPTVAGADGAECFALNNFWRSVANLTIEVNGLGQGGCRENNFWAVSQASSMRRVDVVGGALTLMDYCSAPSFASGGFIADSRAGVVINGSQQQWLIRDSQVGTWTNAVWNQVFSGVVGAPSDSAFPDPPYTTLERTPLSREKPYLYVDAAGVYQVRVPAARKETRGTSWAAGTAPGRSIPLRDFHVAKPSDTVRTINQQLDRGKHLLLTPGMYDVDRSIRVRRPNTVVLGLGMATLTAVRGATPLVVEDRPGIVVAGVTVDAGVTESPILLQVGKRNGQHGRRDALDPITLSDVYFRVGGPHVGRADTALEVNADGVLIDHTWVWRADHGIEGFDESDGVKGDNARWRTNIGRTGAVINGDDVTATGLFVEHFQRYNTVWNGENGRVVLYQNELPYDPPTQADWTTPDGTLGWAGYKVGARVRNHTLWGGGVYAFNRNNPDIVTANGFEVPRTPGVRLIHVMTKNLSGPGTISAVVNGVGAPVDGVPDPGDPDDYENPSYVVSYP